MRPQRRHRSPIAAADGRPGAPPPQRLQKLLAARGLGSRREVETWIAEGRISVDRRRAHLGQKVRGDERIELDGRSLEAGDHGESLAQVLIYHKPEGEIVSRSDPRFRSTVFDRLPAVRGGRWIAVGRLDMNSRGLLLLTTDGELAYRLTHPKYAVEREYAVRVLGEVDVEALERLRRGVELVEGRANFERLEPLGGEGANRWYRVSLREGRNREVRRLWEAVGARVSRLIRTRYGCVSLPREVRPGNYQRLHWTLRNELYGLVGMPPPEKSRGTRAGSVMGRPKRKRGPVRRT